MARSEAVTYVREHGDDDQYERPPDGQDRADGLWSLCCVAVEPEEDDTESTCEHRIGDGAATPEDLRTY
jgi:hypothetical protein